MEALLLCAYVVLHIAVALLPRVFVQHFGFYAVGLICLILASLLVLP